MLAISEEKMKHIFESYLKIDDRLWVTVSFNYISLGLISLFSNPR